MEESPKNNNQIKLELQNFTHKKNRSGRERLLKQFLNQPKPDNLITTGVPAGKIPFKLN